MLDTAKIPRGTARTRSPDDRLPMTPATASIPITVRTEITLVALPTHHRRRRPEPRAFNRGGVVRLRLDGNRQSVVGRMITTQSWGRSCGRQTGRSGPGGGLGFGALGWIATRTPVLGVLADYSWLWEDPIESSRLLTEIATAVRAGPCIHRGLRPAGLPPYSLLTLHDDLDLAAWIERWAGAWRCS
jgi:hypothetical protein